MLEKILKLQQEKLTMHTVITYDKTYFDYVDEVQHMGVDDVHTMFKKVEAAAAHIRKHFKEIKNGQTKQASART